MKLINLALKFTPASIKKNYTATPLHTCNTLREARFPCIHSYVHTFPRRVSYSICKSFAVAVYCLSLSTYATTLLLILPCAHKNAKFLRIDCPHTVASTSERHIHTRARSVFIVYSCIRSPSPSSELTLRARVLYSSPSLHERVVNASKELLRAHTRRLCEILILPREPRALQKPPPRRNIPVARFMRLGILLGKKYTVFCRRYERLKKFAYKFAYLVYFVPASSTHS